MAKLKDKYTAQEIYDHVYEVEQKLRSIYYMDARAKTMVQYFTEKMQLDKEQVEEMLRLYEGEYGRDPSLVNLVRTAYGLPEVPLDYAPFPCAKIQLGIPLDYTETEEFDEMYIKYEKQVGREADDIPSCLKLKVIDQLRKSGKMGPGKIVKEISPMEESYLKEKAKKFPFILEEDSMLPRMSR